ncbi:hypothetical protein [Aminobacter sp. AP02]|uniref:hypothetical protein n=1 Tax=Aminobacter sp. AP02 TaxID=2135737 RepID=UPI001FE0114B|nr:hypothetical protein [Aminobacter sp. AP02]
MAAARHRYPDHGCAVAAGREAGCEEAWLGTELDNVPARALYASRKAAAGAAETFVMYVYDLNRDG